MIEAADIVAGDPPQRKQGLAMWAAVLDQAHRAALSAPQGEELAEHLHTHRPPKLHSVADMDRVPETPQIAACQSAGADMGEILSVVRWADHVYSCRVSSSGSTP